jgi:hypothetical protein
MAPDGSGNLQPFVVGNNVLSFAILCGVNIPALPAFKLQDRLSEAKYFTKLDLGGAYNQIRMKAEEEWKTALRTRYGLYEYTVMSLELTNAPSKCQEMINDALRQYLDWRNMYSMSLKAA